MLAQPPQPSGTLLGQGRAARVYLEQERGRPIARKVFDSGELTRLVQYAFLGAANPYAWSEHAVRAAFLRRRILARLVPLWLEGRMRVAEALGHGWSPTEETFVLDTEWIPGRPPRLHHPLVRGGREEALELRDEVLPRLHAHLREAGFDGMLWQAGYGNPVAFANFLLEDLGPGQRRWAWIDLESGVPALFPPKPRALLETYLPLCWRHRAPLFDHTDTARLRSWLVEHAATLQRDLGESTWKQLCSDAAALEVSHDEFWRLTRLQRSIASQRAKGRLSEEEAELWAHRPIRWWARESLRGLRGGLRRLGERARQAWSMACKVPWSQLPGASWRFLSSGEEREAVARRVLHLRLSQWRSRGSITGRHAERLEAAVDRQGSSVWLSDFAVHVAIKPLVKAIEWLVFPSLLVAGIVDQGTAGLAILAGGSVSRTLYTGGRVLHDLLRGRRAPWIALGVGTLPVVGNLAFPAQIAWRSREEEDLAAQFLLYDGLSVLGRRLPIWGGRDTWTELRINHWVDRIVDGRTDA